MSELTFNIADYRPLFRVRTHNQAPAAKERNGFAVMSSGLGAREYAPGWYDPGASVVEIRTVREAHRESPRRAKILRFSNPASHRLYTMPAQESHRYQDDDPGPLVA
jgi:hypothetical protein